MTLADDIEDLILSVLFRFVALNSIILMDISDERNKRHICHLDKCILIIRSSKESFRMKVLKRHKTSKKRGGKSQTFSTVVLIFFFQQSLIAHRVHTCIHTLWNGEIQLIAVYI